MRGTARPLIRPFGPPPGLRPWAYAGSSNSFPAAGRGSATPARRRQCHAIAWLLEVTETPARRSFDDQRHDRSEGFLAEGSANTTPRARPTPKVIDGIYEAGEKALVGG